MTYWSPILWNFSCFWYILERHCIVSSLSLHKLPLFHLILCNGVLIWTQLWVLKVSLLFWTSLTLLFNHACFLLVFLTYFLNNVINLLKSIEASHFALETGRLPESQSKCLQPCLAWLSWDKNFLYTNTFLSVRYSASCCSHNIPWFSSILWSASLLSYEFQYLFFILFYWKEKNNALPPSPFLYKLFSVSSVFQLGSATGVLTHSEFLDLPFIHSSYSSDSVNFSQTTELSKYLKILICPIYFKLSNINNHKYHEWQSIISHNFLVDAEIYLNYET